MPFRPASTDWRGLCTAWPSVGRAQTIGCPVRPDTDADASKIAGEWFAKGTQHVLRKEYEAAWTAFQCSLSLVEHPATLLNTAKAAKLSDNLAASLSSYMRFLEKYPDSNKSAFVEQEIEAIASTLRQQRQSRPTPSTKNRITTRRNPEMFDGEADPWAEDPSGPLSNPAKNIASKSISEAPADADRAYLTQALPEIPANQKTEIAPPPPETPSPYRAILYPLLGAGGCTLAVGLVFQGMAKVHQIRGQKDDIAFDDFNEHQRKMERYQNVATIGLSVGGALVLAGITGLLITGNKEPPPKETALFIEATPTEVAIGTRF